MQSGQLYKLRSFYLFIGLASGSFSPYLTLLLVNNGLTSSDVGVIMAIGTLVSIFAQPVWGVIADRYQQMRLVLILSVAVPGIMVLFYQSQSFLIIMLVYSIITVFAATQAPIADSYAIVTAQRVGVTYGSIRLLASLGFAIGSYAGGWLVSLSDVSNIWIPYLVLNGLAAAVALLLPRKAEEDHSLRKSFTEGIKELLGNRIFLFFLAGSLLLNQTLTAFNTYFVLAFRIAGGSDNLAGLAMMLAAITNVPSMLIASKVIKRIGLERTMLLAAIAYMLRWAIQIMFPHPYVMIGVQTLHGLSFGFFYIAAVEYVARVSGKSMQATGQSIFSMVFVGVAGIMGNALNGFLLDIGGPDLMNLACVISAALGVVMLMVVVFGTKNKELHRSREIVSALRK